jgi:hypothetical protein
MELILRTPVIEIWAISLVFIQAALLAITYYRSRGALLSAIFDSGKNITLGSRIQLDALSKVFLYTNTLGGVLVFVGWYLVDAYFVNTALFFGIIAAILFLLLWHLDYLMFWSVNGDVKIAQQYIGVGNVWWFLFGIALALSNAYMVFNTQKNWGAFIFIGILVLALLMRLLNGFLFAVSKGFSWYYIILYLCTVYLLPVVLIKKLFGAFWLELLTH